MSCPPKKIVYTGVNRPEIPPLPYVAVFLGTPCIYINIYNSYIYLYILFKWPFEGLRAVKASHQSSAVQGPNYGKLMNDRQAFQCKIVFYLIYKLNWVWTPRDTERQRHSRVDMIASLGDQLAFKVGVASRKWSSIFGKTTILQLKE